jgi:hypothetical protein
MVLPYENMDYNDTNVDLTGYVNLDGIANNSLIYVENNEAKESGLEWNSPSSTLTNLRIYDVTGIFSVLGGVIEVDTSSLPIKLHLSTGGIESTRGITITSQGQVGFGVTNPTEDFELDGNIQLDTGGTSKIIFYDKTNDHEHAEIDAEGEGTNGGNLIFKTKAVDGSVGERIKITADGYVGINYATPNKHLVVGGDADIFGNFLVSGNGVFNNLRVGDMGYGSQYAGITHSTLSANNYAILQQDTGLTMINSSVGQSIKIRNGNITEYGEFNGTQLKINEYGFYSTPGVTVNTVTPLIFFINVGGVASWWCRASNNTGGLIASSNNNSPSDDRLKYNETVFSNGIELVKQMRPTKYDQVISIDDDESTGIPQYGFIADEIESIPGLDILVNEKPDQHYPENGETVKALNYNGVMTISVQALREVIDLVETQQTEISRLTADVTSLETRAETMETTVTRLNDRVATLENQRTENASILTDIVSRLHALEEM